jgi:AcrR family transcriptional regulator
MKPAPSYGRIIDGTLRLLARRGPRRLSMTDICVESGVSRGTLYRYFANRDEVFEAVEASVEATLRDALRQAVAAHPDPADRAEVVLEGLAQHARSYPVVQALVQQEPGLVRDYLQRHYDALLELVATHLDTALDDAPAVRDQLMTGRQLADVLLRLVLAHLMMPDASEGYLGANGREVFGLLTGQAQRSHGDLRMTG